MSDEYIIHSNREAGDGRYDIRILKKDHTKGIILEFKVAKDEEDLKKSAIEGIEQIEKKKYVDEFIQYNPKDIYIYGISFNKKDSYVVNKENRIYK